MAGINHPWFQLFFIMSILAVSRSADLECIYTLYIRTSKVSNAETEPKISATFYDTNGNGLEIGNVASWGGMMGANYKYFQTASLDIFSNKAPCLTAPICAMNLTSDGSGANSGWFCNDLELSITGAGKTCAKQMFIVEQWLATDAVPYQLSAFRDYCDFSVTGNKHHHGSGYIAKV